MSGFLREIRLAHNDVAAKAHITQDSDYVKWLAEQHLLPPLPKAAGKPYIARIWGLSDIYGLDRRFMQGIQEGNEWVFHISPGVYEISKHNGDTPVRGFVLHDEQGMKRLNIREVVAQFTT